MKIRAPLYSRSAKNRKRGQSIAEVLVALGVLGLALGSFLSFITTQKKLMRGIIGAEGEYCQQVAQSSMAGLRAKGFAPTAYEADASAAGATLPITLPAERGIDSATRSLALLGHGGETLVQLPAGSGRTQKGMLYNSSLLKGAVPSIGTLYNSNPAYCGAGVLLDSTDADKLFLDPSIYSTLGIAQRGDVKVRLFIRRYNLNSQSEIANCGPAWAKPESVSDQVPSLPALDQPRTVFVPDALVQESQAYLVRFQVETGSGSKALLCEQQQVFAYPVDKETAFPSTRIKSEIIRSDANAAWDRLYNADLPHADTDINLKYSKREACTQDTAAAPGGSVKAAVAAKPTPTPKPAARLELGFPIYMEPGTSIVCRDVSRIQPEWCVGPEGKAAKAYMPASHAWLDGVGNPLPSVGGNPAMGPDSPLNRWLPCDQVTACGVKPFSASWSKTASAAALTGYKNVQVISWQDSAATPTDRLWGCDIRIDVASIDPAGNVKLQSRAFGGTVYTGGEAMGLFFQPTDCYDCTQIKRKKFSFVTLLIVVAVAIVAAYAGPLILGFLQGGLAGATSAVASVSAFSGGALGLGSLGFALAMGAVCAIPVNNPLHDSPKEEVPITNAALGGASNGFDISNGSGNDKSANHQFTSREVTSTVNGPAITNTVTNINAGNIAQVGTSGTITPVSSAAANADMLFNGDIVAMDPFGVSASKITTEGITSPSNLSSSSSSGVFSAGSVVNILSSAMSIYSLAATAGACWSGGGGKAQRKFASCDDQSGKTSKTITTCNKRGVNYPNWWRFAYGVESNLDPEAEAVCGGFGYPRDGNGVQLGLNDVQKSINGVPVAAVDISDVMATPPGGFGGAGIAWPPKFPAPLNAVTYRVLDTEPGSESSDYVYDAKLALVCKVGLKCESTGGTGGIWKEIENVFCDNPTGANGECLTDAAGNILASQSPTAPEKETGCSNMWTRYRVDLSGAAAGAVYASADIGAYIAGTAGNGIRAVPVCRVLVPIDSATRGGYPFAVPTRANAAANGPATIEELYLLSNRYYDSFQVCNMTAVLPEKHLCNPGREVFTYDPKVAAPADPGRADTSRWSCTHTPEVLEVTDAFGNVTTPHADEFWTCDQYPESIDQVPHLASGLDNYFPYDAFRREEDQPSEYFVYDHTLNLPMPAVGVADPVPMCP